MAIWFVGETVAVPNPEGRKRKRWSLRSRDMILSKEEAGLRNYDIFGVRLAMS